MTAQPFSHRVALVVTVLFDLVLVGVFCAIGRLSHDEGILSDIPGYLMTLWPFAVALLLAHLPFLLRGLSTVRMRHGIVLWIVTVVLGMLLRAASGQGMDPAFIIVATITLAAFLLGWRGIRTLIGRRGAQAPPAA